MSNRKRRLTIYGLISLALVAVVVLLLYQRRQAPVDLEVVEPTNPELLEPRVAKLLDRLVKKTRADPANGSLHGELGMAYEANQLWAEALGSYLNAAILEPSEILWRYHVAIATAETGDFAASLDQLRQLAQQNPDFAPAQQRLGIALLELGDFGATEAAFGKVLELRPERPEGYIGAAEVRLRRGEPEGAVPLLESALGLAPGNRTAHHLLGTAYRYLGLADKAERELAAGVGTQPYQLPDALSAEIQKYAVSLPDLIDRAEALRQQGKIDESVRILESCAASHPDNLTVLNNLASAYLSQGEPERARQTLDRALEIEGGNFETYILLTMWALRTDRLEEALQYADAAVERGDKLAETHSGRAQVLVKLRRFEEAAASMEEALRLEMRNPRIYLGLGVLYESLDRLDDARDLYNQAVEKWPDLLPAYLGIASVEIAEGRTMEAESALDAARAIDASDPGIAELERRLGAAVPRE
jgi:tetratricopeptide (TPR) repeat protein